MYVLLLYQGGRHLKKKKRYRAEVVSHLGVTDPFVNLLDAMVPIPELCLQVLQALDARLINIKARDLIRMIPKFLLE